MRCLAVLTAVNLAACGTAPPAAVDVPLPVTCVREVPRAPALVTDAELRAMNEYQLPLALWRDRLQRRAYERELETVVAACQLVAAPSSARLGPPEAHD